jgi:hypothetical protein
MVKFESLEATVDVSLATVISYMHLLEAAAGTHTK